MCFIVMVIVHMLVQECFCSEDFVTEAAPPLNTMVSVPSSMLYVIPASRQIMGRSPQLSRVSHTCSWDSSEQGYEARQLML